MSVQLNNWYALVYLCRCKQYRSVQARLFAAWADYDAGKITTRGLLRQCSHFCAAGKWTAWNELGYVKMNCMKWTRLSLNELDEMNYVTVWHYYNITLRFFCIWVRVDLGYELTWVRVDLVRVDFGYELTVYHSDLSPVPVSWHNRLFSINKKSTKMHFAAKIFNNILLSLISVMPIFAIIYLFYYLPESPNLHHSHLYLSKLVSFADNSYN